MFKDARKAISTHKNRRSLALPWCVLSVVCVGLDVLGCLKTSEDVWGCLRMFKDARKASSTYKNRRPLALPWCVLSVVCVGLDVLGCLRTSGDVYGCF